MGGGGQKQNNKFVKSFKRPCLHGRGGGSRYAGTPYSVCTCHSIAERAQPRRDTQCREIVKGKIVIGNTKSIRGGGGRGEAEATFSLPVVYKS